MKQIAHKIMSLVMAFVVLFSTISFTVDLHYCGGTLVEIAILTKAKGCGMEMETSSVEGCSITKKNCCSDEHIVVPGQDELKISFENFNIENQPFIVSLIYSYIYIFESYDEDINSFKEYKPPLVIRRIYKIDETYLI